MVSRWFDRKFEFTFPVGLFPNLCVRLRGTPARLEEMLLDRPRARLIQRPDSKWSIQEHVGHLLDLEELWIARLYDFVKGASQLSVADLSNRKTDEANHNSTNLDDILRRFRAARTQLVTEAEKLAPELHSRTILHPRLKQPMRAVDHLYFAAEHDDHHIARIWDLLRD